MKEWSLVRYIETVRVIGCYGIVGVVLVSLGCLGVVGSVLRLCRSDSNLFRLFRSCW